MRKTLEKLEKRRGKSYIEKSEKKASSTIILQSQISIKQSKKEDKAKHL